jgi:hypothetical protein
MNLKALFLVLVLGFSSTAFAQFFPANPRVTVLPLQVTTQVVNTFGRPVVCNGQVYGQLATGQILTTYFAHQVILPGQFRYAAVNTNTFNPFIRGWANIFCQFTWY